MSAGRGHLLHGIVLAALVATATGYLLYGTLSGPGEWARHEAEGEDEAYVHAYREHGEEAD